MVAPTRANGRDAPSGTVSRGQLMEPEQKQHLLALQVLPITTVEQSLTGSQDGARCGAKRGEASNDGRAKDRWRDG